MENLTENSLVVYFDNNQVEPETKKTLLQSFESFFIQSQSWKEKAEVLVITSIDQKDEIKQAKEARLALKAIRLNTEHKRKELKEESLRKGQTIDAIAKIIINEILPIEEHLEKQEKFAEIQEAKRIAELKESRLQELSKYDVDGSCFDLGNMMDENYSKFLENSRLAHEAKVQATILAEKERLERERAEAEEKAKRERIEAEEREKISIENEQLRKKAEEREKAFAAERERLEAIRKKEEEKLRKERELSDLEAKNERKERERIEAELKAKQEADAKAILEAQEKIEAELSRGDREKFISLISDIESLKDKYSFKSKKYKRLQSSINELLTKTVIYGHGKTLQAA